MTVISALFKKIAARVPDGTQAEALLTEAAKAESPKSDQDMAAAQKPGDPPQTIASAELLALEYQIYQVARLLEKIKSPLALSQDRTEDESEDWWQTPIKSITVDLLHEEKRLMRFSVSRNEDGKFYIEAEENSGNGTIALSMMNNRPAENIGEVQQALAQHLDSGFNIPADQAAAVLQRLTEIIDHRPKKFLELIKTAPFEDVLAFVKKGINAAHVYDEYPGKFLPLDWVLMSRHSNETIDGKSPTPFTPAQRSELFEAVVAQAKPGQRIISRMTMRQASTHGTHELLPRLIELGAIPDASNFAEAGGIDDARMLATLKALRPYAPDVNEGAYSTTAAQSAAARANLESFKWLETQGMDKYAEAPNYMTTYAHWVTGSSHREYALKAGQPDKWPAFMQHLIDNGYPIDVAGKGGTPLQHAVESGTLDMAKMLIAAGAKTDASLMEKIITPVYYMQKVSTTEAKEFLTWLHAEHGVPFTNAAPERLFGFMKNSVGENYFDKRFEGIKAAAEMVEFFANNGAKAAETPEIAAMRTAAAEKLRGTDPAVLSSLGIEALPVIKRQAGVRPSVP